MCGIVGYTGSIPALDVLVEGLHKLEYRGYDSAGVALVEGDGIETVRSIGKIDDLEKALAGHEFTSCCGIGHTRWATHGKPSTVNAHPHADCAGDIAVVHNGIIENYVQLRDELQAEGHEFSSETDTETIAHLIEKYYDGNLLEALQQATEHLQGAYGIAAVHANHPGQIAVTRKDSPIVVGYAEGDEPAALVASDMVAIMDFTRDVVFLEDGQFALMSADGIDYYDAEGTELEPEVTHVDWDAENAERGGFPDFMLKEIYEQPRAVRDTIAGAVKNGHVLLEDLNLDDDEIEELDNVYIIGCGTSYHAGLIARELIEQWARIPTTVEVASEFRYRNPIVSSSTLVIAISQSGETADTLAAVRLARSKGARVFAITNCMGSRITRESDGTLYVKANMEISVAATKSFLAQISCLALIAMFLGQKRHRLTTRQVNALYYELRETPAQIEDILQDTDAIEQAAHMLAKAHSAMYVGRGIGATVCNEGALKLKEISYLHAEAYPAGELKHGPIALLDENTPVVAVITDSPTRMQTLSNVQEILARGSHLIAVATEGDEEVARVADHVLWVPPVRDWCSAITASVPLQLLARFVALERGCDVDHPRNLAKSVTVE